MLPLDLHVLSLSLAFILSQDQTLRCSNCFMSLLKIPLFPGSSILLIKIPLFPGSSILLTVFILNTCTTVVYVNFSKNSSQSFLSKRGAKVRIFIFIFQIFSKVFSIYFFSEVSSGTTSGHSLGSSNLIPRFLSFRVPQPLFHHVTTASLSIAGAKVLL